MVKRGVLLLTLLLITASCGSEKAAEPVKVKSVSGIKTETVKANQVVEEASFSGYVIPKKEILLSPKVVGYLIRVNVAPGDRVKRNQVLALIDNSDIKPDVEKASAGIKEINETLKELDRALEEVKARKEAAEANYILAERTFERFKNLLREDAVSKQKFDEVRAQYKAAKANLEAVKAKELQILQKKKVLLAKREQIEAGLRKAEAYLSYTKLKSPVNGLVLQKLVDPGNLVSPQTPVLKVGEFPLLVRAFVDNNYINKVRVGSKVNVVVKGKSYEGKIVEVDESSDPVSHKFGIKVLVPELKEIPGTYAVVKFPEKVVNTITVPESAIYRLGALEYVFVIKDGIAHLRLVKTGERIGSRVVVLSGLNPGERIAVSNVNNLVDGARVEG
ncbi:RND family efflux transporter, MFP subunit [Balnearium lithotrophicum]|uniref:RND family efflux transporter, MFP subunit n=1 Tax=Balnearium lithotrophicum TaxID=223788 RepID=A0A521ABQ6_9BACT|nr:efflux RND transporter periplasmic adaptor subunit [Balnearium lithotrophicum]SMO32160.1 RND family efflux transporter, MFP subunit [Balnearium lithotrophicum]